MTVVRRWGTTTPLSSWLPQLLVAMVVRLPAAGWVTVTELAPRLRFPQLSARYT
jgi:hypothetical protein